MEGNLLRGTVKVSLQDSKAPENHKTGCYWSTGGRTFRNFSARWNFSCAPPPPPPRPPAAWTRKDRGCRSASARGSDSIGRTFPDWLIRWFDGSIDRMIWWSDLMIRIIWSIKWFDAITDPKSPHTIINIGSVRIGAFWVILAFFSIGCAVKWAGIYCYDLVNQSIKSIYQLNQSNRSIESKCLTGSIGCYTRYECCLSAKVEFDQPIGKQFCLGNACC